LFIWTLALKVIPGSTKPCNFLGGIWQEKPRATQVETLITLAVEKVNWTSTMKFGRNLPRNVVPEWSASYIKYKALKRLIKSAAEDTKAGKEADLAGKLAI
jgi:SPX domain